MSAWSDPKPVGYGLVGAGGFGRFCVEQYRKSKRVKPLAVSDQNRAAAESLGRDFDLEVLDFEGMLSHSNIELVHLATPPTTHAELAIRALDAGKHVLCEKPLAIELDDAKRMIDAASRNGKRLSVNLIMRYNPLAEAVKALLEAGLIGQPLFGDFLNAAKDEQLGPDHWFWQRDQSGGIFVEHAVHFFDLFEWWLGEGEVVAAHQTVRPGTDDLIEQVHATLRYPAGPLMNFYHGFTQAERMDRQTMRILCERGSITLIEWVPTTLKIDALLTDAQRDELMTLLPNVELLGQQRYTGPQRRVTSRHREYEADARCNIAASVGVDKPELYGQMLRSLIDDLAKSIREPGHACRITGANGVRSLEVATAATRLAATSAATSR